MSRLGRGGKAGGRARGRGSRGGVPGPTKADKAKAPDVQKPKPGKVPTQHRDCVSSLVAEKANAVPTVLLVLLHFSVRAG